MDSGMKYIVFDDDTYVMAPANVGHNDMRIMGKTPVGAGFLTVNEYNPSENKFDVSCYGESITIGIKSRMTQDATVIQYGMAISHIGCSKKKQTINN